MVVFGGKKPVLGNLALNVNFKTGGLNDFTAKRRRI
jgi:hypothetical protein